MTQKDVQDLLLNKKKQVEKNQRYDLAFVKPSNKNKNLSYT